MTTTFNTSVRTSGNKKRRNLYKSKDSYVDESLFGSTNKGISFHEVKFDAPWIKDTINQQAPSKSLSWNSDKIKNNKMDREQSKSYNQNLKRPFRKQRFKSSFVDESLFGDGEVNREKIMKELPPWADKERGKYIKPLLWDPDPSNIRIEVSRSSNSYRPASASGSFPFSRSSSRGTTYGNSSISRRPQSAAVRPPWR